MEKIKLIALDVDGTVAKGNIWQKVHAVAGVTSEEDNLWFGKYYRKEVSFSDWADFVNARYATCGKKRFDFEKVMDTIELISGAQEVVRFIMNTYHVCLISSGIDYYVAQVAQTLGVKEFYANYSIVYDSKDVVQKITSIAPEDTHKVMILRNMCRERNLVPEQIMYVGDSFNDIPAFSFTKRGVAVGKGNVALMQTAWKQINSIRDLPKLLINE